MGCGSDWRNIVNGCAYHFRFDGAIVTDHRNGAIFLFSDHGDFTGDYGLVEKTQNTLEDCLCRVPLIVKPPASVPVQPCVNDALVELVHGDVRCCSPANGSSVETGGAG